MEGIATKLLYPATLKVVFALLQTVSRLVRLKVMLHETIRTDDFLRNFAFHYRCNVASNCYNVVPTL